MTEMVDEYNRQERARGAVPEEESAANVLRRYREEGATW